MATIVNNPSGSSESGTGFLLGVILIIVFAVLFFVYVLPYLRTSFQAPQGPQINVPSQVDVNLKQQK